MNTSRTSPKRAHLIKNLKRFLIGLFILIALLFSTIVGVVWWAYKNPEQVFSYIEKKYFPPDLKINWKSFDFQFQRQEGLTFLLLLDLDQVYIEKENPLVKVLLDKVYVKATLHLRQDRRWQPLLVAHQIQLEAKENVLFHMNTPPDPEAEEKTPLQTLDTIVQLLKKVYSYVHFENINVDLKDVIYKSYAGLNLKNALIFNLHEQSNIDLDLMSKSLASPEFDLKMQAQVYLKKINTTEPFIDGKIVFSGFDTKLEDQFSARYGAVENTEPTLTIKTKDHALYTLKPNKKTSQIKSTDQKLSDKNTLQKLKIDSQSQFTITKSQVDSQFIMDIQNVPGEISRFKNVNAQIKILLDEKQTFANKNAPFSIQAPIELLFIKDRLRKSLQSSCQCRLPLQLKLNVDGEMNLRQIQEEPLSQVQALKAKASLETLQNDVFLLDAKANVTITKEKKEYFFDPYIDLKAHVTRFKKLSPLLNAYGIMVPSPLDVLDGRIDLVAKGPIEIVDLKDKSSTYTFPADLKTDLQSQKQVMKTEVIAKTTVNSQFNEATVDAKVKIHDLQLELPPLEPAGGKPRITHDKRIIRQADLDKQIKKNDRIETGVQNPDSDFKLIVNYEVETTKNAGVRLLYDMFKPYLGLNIKIQSTNLVENTGFVELVPFDVVYFRRRVHLEHMKLGFRDDENGFNVDGRLSVQHSMYTIYIDILGTSTNPVVSLSSSPYLERSDIISVLLYDRTQDQLISADAETAGSVQAAIADRAIGLFGLWAFAATPIRSFYYNPISKVYTATVDLGDGVSAGIGSDWESSTQLELRKRVSRQWVLTGRWTSPSLDKKEKTELVLQWEKRF